MADNTAQVDRLEMGVESLVISLSEMIESVHNNTNFKSAEHKNMHEHTMRRINNRLVTLNADLKGFK